MSEVAGRSAVLHLIKILTALLQRILRDKIDTGQAQGAGIEGYQYEGAESSFEL